ncbi:MAG: ABC transporter permease, partial [Candidatus Tectomicrobia bacterium]|nr:ABC transporter permease [Candidatus Tectomicrobia bacterium]
EDDFSLNTLEKVKQISYAGHIAKIDEYIYAPQIDPSKENAYAMVIGLRPGAAMRAIGEVDYENAKIIAGHGLREEDADQGVAVIGRLYAKQRVGIAEIGDGSLTGKEILLNGGTFRLIGIYTTENDFGDNHVFIPLEAFRRTYNPGQKLSKIFVTVNSVANVENVVEELKAIREADVVTTPEAVSTAKTTLRNIATSSMYASILLFLTGGILVAFVMALITKERIREIGTLKAIGASNAEIIGQFMSEVFVLTLASGTGGVLVVAASQRILQQSLGLSVRLDGEVLLFIVIGCFTFAAIGSLYPIFTGVRLQPIEAMRKV